MGPINRFIVLCFAVSCLLVAGSSQNGLNNSPPMHQPSQQEVTISEEQQIRADAEEALPEGPPHIDIPEVGLPNGWDFTPKEDLQPQSSDLTIDETIGNEDVEVKEAESPVEEENVIVQLEETLPAEEPTESPGNVPGEDVEELVPEAAPAVNNSARVNDTVPEDEIPSFSEWTQKVLAKEEQSGSNGESTQPAPTKNGNTKLRQKNYASPDCGAKVIKANAEAEHTSAILVPARDEYFLSPCSAKIWFVVELCEAIQAQRIEIANFELFSSSPQDFKVFISDRYPTRDWTLLGNFRAADERSIQSFPLEQKIFGKFVKVELVSHYGKEHFCPISLFHVFGNSEYEVLDSENTQEVHDSTEEDMLFDQTKTVEPPSDDNPVKGQNLFGSAKDAVINIVKKAAEALGKGTPSDTAAKLNSTAPVEDDKKDCHTAAQQANVTKAVNGSLSCQWNELDFLASLPWLQSTQLNQCQLNEEFSFQSIELAFAQSIWGQATIEALCHWIIPEVVPSQPEIEPTVVLEIPESKPEEVAPLNDSEIFQPDELINLDQIFGYEVEPGQEEQPPEPKPTDNQLNTNANVEPSKPVPLQQQQQQQQKESVFVRLSNRIKVLERNMSLSGQYLEELSRRYKRQVDDMQKSLNRTLQTLNETLHRMTSQEQRYQLTLSLLQEELVELRSSSERLHQENFNLKAQMESHLFLMVLEVLVMASVIVYMLRRMRQISPSPPSSPQPMIQDRGGPVFINSTGHMMPEATGPLTLNVSNLANGKKQQVSPTPSLAESSSSGCESAFSFANSTRGEASRDPSPVDENKILQHKVGKKQKKKNKSQPAAAENGDVHRVNNARSQSTGPKIRLKSDNWEWHSRAKVLAAQFIKENYDANGALRCSF